MHHLNQPELSQFTSIGASDRMYAKFSVMGGMQVPALASACIFNPALLLTNKVRLLKSTLSAR